MLQPDESLITILKRSRADWRILMLVVGINIALWFVEKCEDYKDAGATHPRPTVYEHEITPQRDHAP